MRIIDAELRLVHESACSSDFALRYLSEGVIRDIYADPAVDHRLWLSSSLERELVKSGVDGGILSGLAWKDPCLQEENNQAVYRFCKSKSKRMKAFYMPQVNQGRKKLTSAIESLDRNIFIGIEIIPKWHQLTTGSSDFHYLLDLAREHDLFVKVYTCHPTQNFSGNTVIETFRMLIENQSNRFVIPHCGGGLPLYQLDPRYTEVLGKCLFLGSTSSTIRMCKYFLDINPKNVLFASDFPFNHCKSISSVVESSLSLGLERGQLDQFFFENASKAFGIDL